MLSVHANRIAAVPGLGVDLLFADLHAIEVGEEGRRRVAAARA